MAGRSTAIAWAILVALSWTVTQITFPIEVDDPVDQSPAGKICHDDPDAVSILPSWTHASVGERVCAFIVNESVSLWAAWKVNPFSGITRGSYERIQARRTCLRARMTAYHKIGK